MRGLAMPTCGRRWTCGSLIVFLGTTGMAFSYALRGEFANRAEASLLGWYADPVLAVGLALLE